MTFEVITKDDLKTLKQEIITELKTILGSQTEQKKWLKSADVREMLNISPGTLQNLRVNGTLPFTKMGKTMYYEYDDVIKILTQTKVPNENIHTRKLGYIRVNAQ